MVKLQMQLDQEEALVRMVLTLEDLVQHLQQPLNKVTQLNQMDLHIHLEEQQVEVQ